MQAESLVSVTSLTGPCPLQTTYKGKSSFQTYSDYLRWESFLRQQLQTFPEGSALRRGFQTCEHWKQIFMEIIGGCEPSPAPGWVVGSHTGAATHVEGMVRSVPLFCYPESWLRTQGEWCGCQAADERPECGSSPAGGSWPCVILNLATWKPTFRPVRCLRG